MTRYPCSYFSWMQRGLASLVAGALVVGSMPLAPLAAAAEPAETNPEYAEALSELNSISSQYAALANDQAGTLAKLEDVRGQMADNQAQMEDVQSEMAEREVELAERRELLASHVNAEYKAGSVSLLSIILSSASFEEIVSRIHYCDAIYQAEAAEIDGINNIQSELALKQGELEQLGADLEQQEAELQSLYDEQVGRTEAMYAQQLAAAELLNSLPAEVKESLDEGDALIEDAQAVAQEQSTQQSTEPEPEAQDSNQESTSSANNEQSDAPAEQTPAPATPVVTGNGSQAAVLNAAYANNGAEAQGNGWGCAGWVYCVFRDSGVYDRKPTCAAWYYNNWCFSSDKADLRPGMVVSVSTHTRTSAGQIYGHVGIYVGNNTVRHLSAGAVRDVDLDEWIECYGTTVTPMWGWNGGIALS